MSICYPTIRASERPCNMRSLISLPLSMKQKRLITSKTVFPVRVKLSGKLLLPPWLSPNFASQMWNIREWAESACRRSRCAVQSTLTHRKISKNHWDMIYPELHFTRQTHLNFLQYQNFLRHKADSRCPNRLSSDVLWHPLMTLLHSW